MILAVLAVLAALGAGLWMVWIRKRRREEAEAAARRQERCRQRLMEEGPEAAAEFNRLLEEKKTGARAGTPALAPWIRLRPDSHTSSYSDRSSRP